MRSKSINKSISTFKEQKPTSRITLIESPLSNKFINNLYEMGQRR